MSEILIPDSIRKLISDKNGTYDEIGMFSSTVITYDDCVLKIEDYRDCLSSGN